MFLQGSPLASTSYLWRRGGGPVCDPWTMQHWWRPLAAATARRGEPSTTATRTSSTTTAIGSCATATRRPTRSTTPSSPRPGTSTSSATRRGCDPGSTRSAATRHCAAPASAAGSTSPRRSDEMSGVEVDLDRGTRAEELQELVWSAAAGLSARDQALLDLNLRQGLEGQDLADAMGTSLNNSYVMLSRLRDQVERSLGALLIARLGRDDCEELDAHPRRAGTASSPRCCASGSLATSTAATCAASAEPPSPARWPCWPPRRWCRRRRCSARGCSTASAPTPRSRRCASPATASRTPEAGPPAATQGLVARRRRRRAPGRAGRRCAGARRRRRRHPGRRASAARRPPPSATTTDRRPPTTTVRPRRPRPRPAPPRRPSPQGATSTAEPGVIPPPPPPDTTPPTISRRHVPAPGDPHARVRAARSTTSDDHRDDHRRHAPCVLSGPGTPLSGIEGDGTRSATTWTRDARPVHAGAERPDARLHGRRPRRRRQHSPRAPARSWSPPAPADR